MRKIPRELRHAVSVGTVEDKGRHCSKKRVEASTRRTRSAGSGAALRGQLTSSTTRALCRKDSGNDRPSPAMPSNQQGNKAPATRRAPEGSETSSPPLNAQRSEKGPRSGHLESPSSKAAGPKTSQGLASKKSPPRGGQHRISDQTTDRRADTESAPAQGRQERAEGPNTNERPGSTWSNRNEQTRHHLVKGEPL